jgi:hypothetical protein
MAKAVKRKRQKKTKKTSTKQSQGFRDAVRDLGLESELPSFDQTFRKIMPPKTKKKSDR